MDTQYERMEEEWGIRCAEYEPRCPCCVAWTLFDGGKGVPEVDEVAQRISVRGGTF